MIRSWATGILSPSRNDEVVAILGAVLTGVTNAVADAAVEDGIPMVSLLQPHMKLPQEDPMYFALAY